MTYSSMFRAVRDTLPKPADRLPLGRSGLKVSPFCLGMTASPDSVVAAYEAGINFFFVTADLHWPLYEGIRHGLRKLLDGNPARRDEIVVGVVSYMEDPLFSTLQFHEVIAEVPGLERVDLMIAGAVSNENSLYSRANSLQSARARRHNGSSAIGATFHQRPLALVADHRALLDISYIRYNSGHPGARRDLFPYLLPARDGLVFNFKSVLSKVTEEMFQSFRLPSNYWLPDVCDYYRFVLSRPEIDGILCSPMSASDVRGMVAALDKAPLTHDEQEYMIWLSSLAHAPVLT